MEDDDEGPIHKIFLEFHRKTVLQHSAEQLKNSFRKISIFTLLLAVQNDFFIEKKWN